MKKEKVETKKFRLVLKMVELEDGLDRSQIIEILDRLETIDEDGHKETYMPIEFHENNTSAYGFICSSYYEKYSYENANFEKVINPILDDWDLENENHVYVLEDGEEVYMD